jgi:putative ABC transport system substrate-binding protein
MLEPSGARSAARADDVDETEKTKRYQTGKNQEKQGKAIMLALLLASVVAASRPRINACRQIQPSIGLLALCTLAAWLGTPAMAAETAPRPAMPMIGFLNDLPADQWPSPLNAFRRALGEAGYVEGRNVAFVTRWTDGRRDRLPELAAELARMNVDVIVASGDTAVALAARAATAKIPILFAIEDDPVRFGLATSLDKPGGNATGIYLETSAELTSARQQLLRQLAPGTLPVFYSVQILDASSDTWRTEPDAALTHLLGNLRVRTSSRISDATKQLLKSDPEAGFKQLQQEMGTPDDKDRVTPAAMRSLEIISGPFLDRGRCLQAIALAAMHDIPVLYHWRAFAEAGGLVSHGYDIEEVYADLGRYAAEILHGKNPADLPVQKPAKFETIINLRTAAQLGLNVPPALLEHADKVIQ